MNARNIKKLEKFRETLADMREELDAMSTTLRDKYNNASQRWQDSEAGEACDTEAEQLEQAAADVESAESALVDLCS